MNQKEHNLQKQQVRKISPPLLFVRMVRDNLRWIHVIRRLTETQLASYKSESDLGECLSSGQLTWPAERKAWLSTS